MVYELNCITHCGLNCSFVKKKTITRKKIGQMTDLTRHCARSIIFEGKELSMR